MHPMSARLQSVRFVARAGAFFVALIIVEVSSAFAVSAAVARTNADRAATAACSAVIVANEGQRPLTEKVLIKIDRNIRKSGTDGAARIHRKIERATSAKKRYEALGAAWRWCERIGLIPTVPSTTARP